jgi:hypothetical protein
MMVKIDEKKLADYLVEKTKLVKENIDKLSSDFKTGFELGSSFSALLSSMQAYISLKTLPEDKLSSKDKELIKFFEELQKQFFNEIINVKDFIVTVEE